MYSTINWKSGQGELKQTKVNRETELREQMLANNLMIKMMSVESTEEEGNEILLIYEC